MSSNEKLLAKIQELRCIAAHVPQTPAMETAFAVSAPEKNQENISNGMASKIGNQKDIQEMLADAQNNMETFHAIQEANCGNGLALWTASDCQAYWRRIDFFKLQLENNFQQLQNFIDYLPLDVLSDNDREIVENYMDMRKVWTSIAYDASIPAQDKVSVYKEITESHQEFFKIIDKLFTKTYRTEQLEKYEKMRQTLTETFINNADNFNDRLVGTFNYGFNGQYYKIRVPEEPYFDTAEIEAEEE